MISKARKISNYKELKKELPSKRYVDPEYVYLSLTTNRCNAYDLEVKEGDYVKFGQVIGERSGGFSNNRFILHVVVMLKKRLRSTMEQGSKENF